MRKTDFPKLLASVKILPFLNFGTVQARFIGGKIVRCLKRPTAEDAVVFALLTQSLKASCLQQPPNRRVPTMANAIYPSLFSKMENRITKMDNL